MAEPLQGMIALITEGGYSDYYVVAIAEIPSEEWLRQQSMEYKAWVYAEMPYEKWREKMLALDIEEYKSYEDDGTKWGGFMPRSTSESDWRRRAEVPRGNKTFWANSTKDLVEWLSEKYPADIKLLEYTEINEEDAW